MSNNTNEPKFFERIVRQYKTGMSHAFIVSQNVRDYVLSDNVPTGRLVEYLPLRFASFDIVVRFDRSGYTFATPSMRSAFARAAKLDSQQIDPAIAAAMGMSASDSDEIPADLTLLDKVMRNAVNDEGQALRVAAIIDYAETIVPNADVATMPASERDVLVMIKRWGSDSRIAERGNIIVMLAENLTDVSASIRAASSGFQSVNVPLPNVDERRAYVAWWMSEAEFDTELSVDVIANATAGLSLVHIEDIFLLAQLDGELTHELIKSRKRDIIASEYGDVLEILEPAFGFEAIGGLEHVKNFFVKNVIRPFTDGKRERAPMGVLMTGPAGTGKSAMAVAVAREAGVNACKLQVGGKIASKWQGEGERNLDKALAAIDTLGGIVFIDEIDQVVSRGDGGNAQNSRIFQRLLEYMSDTTHRGRVVFLAATNRPDLMDAALRRPGRFDKKIPFLIPDASERRAIFQVMTRRYMSTSVVVSDFAVESTDGWTGAEIESATIKAFELVEDEALNVEDAIDEATRRLSPSTSDIEFMTDLAIAECNDLDLLPPRYKAQLVDAKAREALETRIAQQSETRKTRRTSREF